MFNVTIILTALFLMFAVPQLAGEEDVDLNEEYQSSQTQDLDKDMQIGESPEEKGEDNVSSD